jgi:tetratricopeptide (TPR) repeat protein
MLKFMVLYAMAATLPQDAARQLESAVYREIVHGDLKSAAAQYRAILGQSSVPRSVAARALYQLGQCLEKLGRLSEARETYNRVLREFGDQSTIIALARVRLADADGSIPGPLNLKFVEGEPNKLPAAWFVPALPNDADNWAQLRSSGCFDTKGSCAVVMAPANAPVHVSNLMQSFSAKAYRGRTVRFRAWIRVESSEPDDHAQMWLSVDRSNGQKGFSDNMSDRPIRSASWISSEIQTRIDDDATFIKFGIMSVGRGRVWVDDVSFDTVP